jgi:hypothetical protein
MLSSWLERPLVPLSKSVRSYAVDALRAVKKAQEILSSGRERFGLEARGRAGIGFELWVHTVDGKVGGFIDHAYFDRNGIVIRDYKSGYVFEASDEQLLVKVNFVVQLRMYAALYHSTFAQWPTRLELTPTQGSSVAIPYEPNQCTELVNAAGDILRKTNADVLRILGTGTGLEELASPSPETCRQCAYRPNCSAYMNVTKESGAGWPLDLWGCLKGITALLNGRFAVSLETSSGTEVIRGISADGRHPALVDVSNGNRLAIFNLQKGFPGGGLTEGLYTTIYRSPR